MNNYKKGFIDDQLVGMIVIFIIAVLGVSLTYVVSTMKNTGMLGFDIAMNDTFDGYLSFNTVAPLMIVALGFALIGSAFLIRTQPAFFAIFLLVNIAFAWVAINLSNAWQSAFKNNAMSSTAALFPGWGIIFKYFPFISIVLSIIFAIAIYAKGED